MKKNELVKRNLNEVAPCDVPEHLREDFVVESEQQAKVLGIGTGPMPHPDGKKPTAFDRAAAKVREQLDPRLAEYRKKVKTGEYDPKAHISAFTAQEARAKGLLGPGGPTRLDMLLDAAPTQVEADRLIDSGQKLALPSLSEDAPIPAPAPPQIDMLPGEEE